MNRFEFRAETLRHPHFSNQNRLELLVEINATSIRLILLVLFFDLSQHSNLDEYDSQLEARYLKYALILETLVKRT